ncbi:MAG TPA: hypothetical protein VIJ36_16990, partial [Thermoanaerobaculia bacterium]
MRHLQQDALDRWLAAERDDRADEADRFALVVRRGRRRRQRLHQFVILEERVGPRLRLAPRRVEWTCGLIECVVEEGRPLRLRRCTHLTLRETVARVVIHCIETVRVVAIRGHGDRL